MNRQRKSRPGQEAANQNQRVHYTTTRAILAKAAPWLALSLSVGGVQ